MIFKKIKFKSIYLGDIYIHESQTGKNIRQIINSPNISLYKENALLLQLCNNAYVDIDNIKNYFSYLSLANLVIDENNFCFGNMILSDIYNPLGDIKYFILNKSLVQADTDDLDYNDIKKLKKSIKKS